MTCGKANFTIEQIAKLNKHNIKIVGTEISEIEQDKGPVHQKCSVCRRQLDTFCSGLRCDTIYPAFGHSCFIRLRTYRAGLYKIDDFQKTTIKGVFACGDNAAMLRFVAHAVHSGNFAGAMANKELTDEQF